MTEPVFPGHLPYGEATPEQRRSEEAALRRWRVDSAAFHAGPRAAANMMRRLAFLAWCPSCQSDEHWNHPKDDGFCRSIERLRNEPCTCPWRPFRAGQ